MRADAWERGFAEVQAYAAEHGRSRVPTRHVTADGYRLGSWVNVQRNRYRAGKLPADRIAKLEALPGWSWGAHDDRWASAFTEARTYADEHGHSQVPDGYVTKDGYPLGRWVKGQREAYRSGKLSADRIARLESLPGWMWNVHAEEWEQGFAEAIAYTAAHGHGRVPWQHVTDDGYRLGNWVSSQRERYRNGALSADRIAKLESLPGWSWDAHAKVWESGFSEVSAYATIHGHSRVPWQYVTGDGYRLGIWVSNQRSRYRAGKLTPDRIAKLETLPGWTWGSPASDKWRNGFDEVSGYATEHRHSQVPNSHVTDNGYRLGNWVEKQRAAYRRGKLSADRVARLESLPGWVWDAR